MTNDFGAERQKIGEFIKQLRTDQGWTQEEFAKALDTSQSAVARMEKGQQNFTTETLGRISQVLNKKILSLASESIDFKIQGGRKLSGQISTNTSKNGAMGLLCASLLNKGKTILHGIPQIEEVKRIIEVFESLDISVRWLGPGSLEIIPPKKLKLENINREAAMKTRTILMFLGPLIHLLPQFELPHSKGCHLGRRTAIAHIYGFEEFGVKIKSKTDNYLVTHGKLKPAEVVMYEAGDTSTENVLLAAAKIPGKSVIKFATSNYMVQEVCFFLQKCGVKVEGIGSSTISVHGVEEINQEVEYHNGEDPIESMMFLSAAIVTGSSLTIQRCPIDFLALELYKLKKMGFKFKRSKVYKSHNGQMNLVDITTYPSQLKAPEEKIHPLPYPGLNMDNLPFFVPIAAMSSGETLIHDWVYENRAIYYMELTKLGAKMILADPHRVYIEGPTQFKPAQIVCPPALRPAMIILIAMLAAEGTSILRNVYSISRGYEEIAERLNQLGADIQVLNAL
jgi:UDP-N-acetylglucosamine 1-carboxyvinyltransferase